MVVGYVIAEGRGNTDRLLSALAGQLETRLRLAGVVQTNTDRTDCSGCDMDVRVISSNQVVRISQSLGVDSKGCRLNPAALEEAVGLVENALLGGADLLIVNKFGKHEASGRGFRPLIGEALARDIPVLLGLNAMNLDAFLEFAGDFSVAMDPDLDVLRDWVFSLTGDVNN